MRPQGAQERRAEAMELAIHLYFFRLPEQMKEAAAEALWPWLIEARQGGES